MNIYLGTAAASTSWQRFERGIEEDWDVYSAASYTNADGLLIPRPSVEAPVVQLGLSLPVLMG